MTAKSGFFILSVMIVFPSIVFDQERIAPLHSQLLWMPSRPPHGHGPPESDIAHQEAVPRATWHRYEKKPRFCFQPLPGLVLLYLPNGRMATLCPFEFQPAALDHKGLCAPRSPFLTSQA